MAKFSGLPLVPHHLARRRRHDRPEPLGHFSGRRAGSHASFTYSDALKDAGWTWDAGSASTQWITNPRAVLAATKMTFIGLPQATDRRDLIAFLKLQTSLKAIALTATLRILYRRSTCSPGLSRHTSAWAIE